MNQLNTPCENIISVKRSEKFTHIYDIELNRIEELKKFSSFECHVVLYPYSRKINSDNLSFNPFEEYVKDISTHQRSAYVELKSSFKEFFGIFLGALIWFMFYKFSTANIYTVESTVSILGAYFIGKDLWDDIEASLISITQKWRIRFTENYYSYRLEGHTTLTQYFSFAQKNRYSKSALFPDQMDFIEKSNSLTARMFFSRDSIKKIKDGSARILSIHIDEDLVEEFEKCGYLLGVKLSFNKKFLGVSKCFEMFQSLSFSKNGCLDEKENWIDNAAFFRKTFQAGRLKYFRKSGIIEDQKIIS